MAAKKTVLMVAAENDALPGAKVGGIGDVVRDLPNALVEQNCDCHVVIPSYGYLHELPGTEAVHHYSLFFAGGVESVTLYKIAHQAIRPGLYDEQRVHLWVIDHPGMYPSGRGVVYCNDGDDRPFASDANKYALFCNSVAQAIVNGYFGELNVLHLHDWHAAFLAILRAYDQRFVSLQKYHTVYSIHNLSLQGVRPFKGDASSFKTWFPSMQYDAAAICDPRVPHCVNPMRAAIGLSDRVHAVSPTYAEEIQRPSHAEQFVYGGEGLESDLQKAASQGRLVGILNGCEYPNDSVYTRLGKNKLAEVMIPLVMQWAAKSTALLTVHWLAQLRLEHWQKKRERGMLITSVGRITEQKVRLLKMPLLHRQKQQSVLDHLLDSLGDDGQFILLGSGDGHYEQFLQEVSARHKNFIFLYGYSDTLAQVMYSSGDLFLMPSSFEPCGISQMLAMRAGQPCLVHGVGGLNDTVSDNNNGFVFYGSTGEEQGKALLKKFEQVLAMHKDTPKTLVEMGRSAAKARFTWRAVAQKYMENLY